MAAPKLKPTAMSGRLIFVFEPVERGQHVAGFCSAVMRSLAQARAAKVEAQDGTAESPVRIVEDLHGMVDNLVVQVAAVERVGVADERGKRRIGRALDSKPLQAGRRDRPNPVCAVPGFPDDGQVGRMRKLRSFHPSFYAQTLVKIMRAGCGLRFGVYVFSVRSGTEKEVSWGEKEMDGKGGY